MSTETLEPDLETILADIRSIRGITAVVIFSRDLTLIASSSLINKAETDMCIDQLVHIAGISDTLTYEFGLGELKHFLIDGEHGRMMIYPVGNDFLALIAEKNVNMGMIGLKVKHIYEDLFNVLYQHDHD